MARSLTDLPMTPTQFRNWRKGLGLKQKEAADRLGLKKRIIQYYEKGERNGKAVEIPRTVRLACYALSQGIGDFDGETVEEAILPAAGADGDGDGERRLSRSGALAMVAGWPPCEPRRRLLRASAAGRRDSG